jgi:peptidoglycan/xylan/chitin deacetylase (PgdA/CDA1 family)
MASESGNANRRPRGGRIHTLMYHGTPDTAGAPGSHRRSYDVPLHLFSRHLERLSALRSEAPSTAAEEASAMDRWALTFDDGAGSCMRAADILDEHGWKAYFFVVSSWIGRQGYLDGPQLNELAARGHVIGSHSASHPDPMSGLSYRELESEWRTSVERLSQVLGAAVTSAAVPGGGLSKAVIRAAAETGVRALFTSEPTSRTRTIDGCVVLGRYAIRVGTPVDTVAALAQGAHSSQALQWLAWNSKKLAKRMPAGSYYKLRKHLTA